MRKRQTTSFPASAFTLCLFTLFLLGLCCTNANAGLADSPWPMFRHDLRHTAVSPYNDPAPDGTFWTYYTGGPYSSCAIGPDGTIYLGAGYYLYAINGNGTFKWRCSIGSSTRSTPAIADDGTVYVGSNDYQLYAVNPNGTVKWSFPTGNQISSSPAIATDGTVYIGSRDGKLYAVNPDGTQKWAYSTGGDIHVSSPAVAPDGTVYVGSYDGNLYAINPNGTEKWHYATGQEVLSSPALNSDCSTIYFNSWARHLYAVSSDGALLWSFPLDLAHGSTSSSPAVGSDGTIYVGSNAGTLHAISPAGAEIWRFETGSDIRSSPAVSADGTVYIACYDGYIYAVNSDGTEKWHFLTKNSIYSSPGIAADGTVVVGSLDGYTYGHLNSTPLPASPPSNLSATALSEILVRLTWQDNSNDEYGFRVERRLMPDGTYAQVATAGANVTTYDDLLQGSGLTFLYRVCAYQEGGNSAYSNEAGVTMPGLASPTDLVATPVSGTQIDLSWTDRSSNELGFRIERMTGPNGHFQLVATIGADNSSYSDASVNPATTYYYRIYAFDATRNSAYSNEAWAQTHGMDFTEVSIGDTSRKQMALTFDCGITPIRPGLLDILRDRNVYCTFFITGRVAEQEPWNVVQLANDGHVVANHTYTHPNLTTLTDEEIVQQLTVTDDVLYNMTGHHTRPYFRPPSGYRDARVLSVAESVGFRSIFWTAGGGDFGGWTTQQIIDNTLNNAQNGCIMLYHASPANTEEAMPTIIDTLRAWGYELVTVPEILAPNVVSSPPSVINPEWNLISIPCEPANPTPLVVFRGIDIDGTLFRWDKETASLIAYDSLDPGGFGIVSPDEGYWLYASTTATIKFAGSEVTTARHIKLPQSPPNPSAAWTIIGCPFEAAQEWGNCSVFNPNAPDPKTRSLRDAVGAGWLYSVFFWWDSATKSLMDAGLPEDLPSTTQIEPWRGYWMQTFVNGLELIIPKP